jgi:hypothetical protein
MFDVFYSGKKPNLFVHEQQADSIDHARSLSRTRYFWWVTYLADYSSFDFLWEPVPWEKDFAHTWSSQWHPYSGTYLVPKHAGTEQLRFHDKIIPARSRPEDYTQLVNGVDFDWTWHPHPEEPPYNYVFGNQWWPSNRMHTVEYRVSGATETKYIFDIRARLPEQHNNQWHTMHDCAWDYSWVPDPGDPPYIYVFGNQWHPAEIMPTVKYTVPGASEVKYMTYPKATLIQDLSRWTIPDNVNRSAFDFSWVPDPGSPPYLYQFGTQWNRAGGPVYNVPGATDIKYTTAQIARMLPTDQNWVIPDGIDINSFDFSWHPDSTEQPYIYQFGTQWQKTGGPRYVVAGASEIKYLDAPRAVKLNRDTHWTVPSGADVESFDWTWHPDTTEQPYIYQFGTQHQRTGGPMYVVPGATEVKYVDQIKIKTEQVATAIFEIDHLDGNSGQIPNTTKQVRYFDNYLDTLKRIAASVGDQHEFVWICSSVCDYTNFDFSWHPEQWQTGMLHVFPSDGEKFGDTFFMHVPTFRYRSEKCQLLEWYDLNFTDKSVPRRPLPVLRHDHDTHVEAIKTLDWTGPLALFTTGSVPASVPVVPLWHEKTKTIVPLSAGASQVIVPKIAVPRIKKQLYDYPYIDKTQQWGQDIESDVIFISNGETMADANWQNLLELCPRARRSDGVLGREAAYKVAAEMSSTPWFFAVFAKTEVLPTFKFDYQPDRLQQPRHYIFHSRNPLNGLEYGAMNIDLYNRQLTIDTRPGIDFTLSSLHTVVPICASISRFNTDPWVTWRSAFREVLKLKLEVDQGADVEVQHRLKVWCTRAEGDNAEYCLAGARNALEYYAEVSGNYDQLCLSFDWAWLQEFYYRKYQRQIWLESI